MRGVESSVRRRGINLRYVKFWRQGQQMNLAGKRLEIPQKRGKFLDVEKPGGVADGE